MVLAAQTRRLDLSELGDDSRGNSNDDRSPSALDAYRHQSGDCDIVLLTCQFLQNSLLFVPSRRLCPSFKARFTLSSFNL